MAADDQVTYAIYLRVRTYQKQKDGKDLKEQQKDNRKFQTFKSNKLRSFRLALKYKYGVQVLRDCNHAKTLDEKNGNTKQQYSTLLEMKKLTNTTHSMIQGRMEYLYMDIRNQATHYI